MQYPLSLGALEGTPREIRVGWRDMARMLVVSRGQGVVHSKVRNLADWMNPGDILVLNNSKRIPGVLRGRTSRGGSVELRFVDVYEKGEGLCSIFPTHDISVGSAIEVGTDQHIRILETGITAHNLAHVRTERGSMRQLLKTQGRPIPGFFYENHWGCEYLNPYYATEEGGVESPLAGLHFTPDLVEKIRQKGIEVCFVTLHSVGSWLPFLEEDVQDHQMWPETYIIPAETALAVNAAIEHGRKIFACGSTSLRALEAGAATAGVITAGRGETRLYITPGYEFKIVSAYFTNFHQYRTSLIVLDAAFAGADTIKSAYLQAVAQKYSFFEFGDAVLLL
ncbi:S-adenosylmethionine:tRNA ribosyltransferase-isomerase [Nocardia gipuzkoensis]